MDFHIVNVQISYPMIQVSMARAEIFPFVDRILMNQVTLIVYHNIFIHHPLLVSHRRRRHRIAEVKVLFPWKIR